MTNYKAVEIKDGNEVQYVGMYILKWNFNWGQPEIGFVEIDDSELGDEYENLSDEIKAAHQTLDKYVDKQHWSIAGRIDDLIEMMIRYQKENRIDELIKKWEKQND